MKIKNVKVYGLEESIIRSGYPMQIGEPLEIDSDIKFDMFHNPESHANMVAIKRANKLAKVQIGSGHDNYLKGIVVQLDLLYTQYWTKHLQRYTWFTYFSGQSQMHKMTTRPLKEACNRYVCEYVIDIVQFLIDQYNSKETVYPFVYDNIEIEDKQQLFQTIMSNCPMGYQLWQPITTNYMSLKTIYNQRKTHKLEEWQEFCSWIKTLPMSELITDNK